MIPAFGPSLCAAGHQLWLFLDLLPEHQPGLMDPSAPPTDQVRTTQVCGGEIPASQNLQHLKKSPSKGVKNTQQNALLQQRKDGSVRLIYSTKTDINYMNYQDRQMLKPVPKEFDMCGLTNLKWASFLSSDSTVRTALTFDPTTEIAQRHHKLNQIKRDELLYQMRQLADPDTGDRFLYADYLTVQVSDGNGTIYEQTAICAAVTRTDLKMIREEDSRDLGYGIFQLSKPRDIAIYPGFDAESLYPDFPSRAGLPVGYRKFLMVYKDVESKKDLIELQNEISASVRLYSMRGV